MLKLVKRPRKRERRRSRYHHALRLELLEERNLLATLTNGTGDGRATIDVDGYGAFGSILGGVSGEAVYDPIGLAPMSTTKASALAVGVNGAARDFLTSGTLGTTANDFPGLAVEGTTEAISSSFSYQGLDFELHQELVNLTQFQSGAAGGTRLKQTYDITNSSGAAALLDIVRYYDGDLNHTGSAEDDGAGLRSTSFGRKAFITDEATGQFSALDPTVVEVSTTTTTTGTAFFNSTEVPYRITTSSSLLDDVNTDLEFFGLVDGDVLPANGVIDESHGYDVAVAFQQLISLAPGDTATFTTVTDFGPGSTLHSLVAEPHNARVPIGSEHTVRYTLLDDDGLPARSPPSDILVSVSGVHSEAGSAVPSVLEAGYEFSYTGTDVGIDQITADGPEGTFFGTLVTWTYADDYGDAPDGAVGTGRGNYRTLLSDDGPRHGARPGLFLGAEVDQEEDAVPSPEAIGDDAHETFGFPDDEDGVSVPQVDLHVTQGAEPTVNVVVTNTTGTDATLYGWIDYDADGHFDNSTERAEVVVPTGLESEVVSLLFPKVPIGYTGKTYARFRLSTDSAAANSYGMAVDGEVEDHVAAVTARGSGVLKSSQQYTEMGNSGAAIGDLDGDGIIDIAIGAYGGSVPGSGRGEVYILFMNSDGTVREQAVIGHETGGGPSLINSERFGTSVVSLGDVDGDGIQDLGIGAQGDSEVNQETGNSKKQFLGAAYVVFMNRDGTAKAFQKIGDRIGGGPDLDFFDYFGNVGSVGDVNADGIPDMAVGASPTDGRGAVYVFLLNRDGTAKSFTKISHSATTGPILSNNDHFGLSVAGIGDIDRDGVPDMAVGALRDNGMFGGVVHILFLGRDGTVSRSHEITPAQIGLAPVFDWQLGRSVAAIEDLNGDGTSDLAVGGKGALYVWLMNTDGTVKSSTRVNSADGFVAWVSSLGDFNSDGIPDLVANRSLLFLSPPADYGDAPDSATGTATADYETVASDNGPSHSVVSGLFLGATVDAEDDARPNFTASGDDTDQTLSDDEDGLVNAPHDLTLTVGTQPKVKVLVTNTTGDDATLWGWMDYNKDGVFDNQAERTSMSVPDGSLSDTVTLAFPVVPPGAPGSTYARFRLSTDDAAASPTGNAIDGEVEDYPVIVQLPSTGTVGSTAKISDISGGFSGGLVEGDFFGIDVSHIGDLNRDGTSDIVVSQSGAAGGNSRGGVWTLFLDDDGTVINQQPIGNGVGGFVGTLDDNAGLGIAVEAIQDLNGDGIQDLVVGVRGDDDGGNDRGAVWVLFMKTDGTAGGQSKISSTSGGLTLPLRDGDQFGSSVASIGDLDGNGAVDLAVGAIADSHTNTSAGAVYVLFMNPDGTVRHNQKLTTGVGGFAPVLGSLDSLGAVANLGDLDGDGVAEMAVGAPGDDDGGADRGAAYVLFMQRDGTAKRTQKISATSGRLPALLDDGDMFGNDVSAAGDINGDGVPDIIVSANGDDDGGDDRGAVYLLFLNPDGTVKDYEKLSAATPGLGLDDGDRFGSAATLVWDVNRDGVPDLAVGAAGDDDGGLDRGAVHLLFLNSVPDADLEITAEDISVSPQAAEFGGQVSVTYTVKNVGGEPANATWSDRIYLSDDELLDATDRPIALISGNGPLQDGGASDDSYTRTSTVTLPTNFGVGDGTHYLIVSSDSGRELPELNDGNNAAAVPIDLKAQLLLELPSHSIAESASNPAIRGVVRRTGSIANELVVTLTSSAADEISVPATVTIPAGHSAATFNVTVFEDDITDGDQIVTITATSDALGDADQQVTVLDIDLPTLTLTVDANELTEGQTIQATITRSVVSPMPLTVSLAATPGANHATLPGTVEIPANQPSTTINVSAVADSLLEIDQLVGIEASSPGFIFGFAEVTVLDDDDPALEIKLATPIISESGGSTATTATVTRGNVTNREIVVELDSSDETELRVPETVTLPAGVASVRFFVAAIDDDIVDQTQDVSLSATARTSITGDALPATTTTAVVSVSDDDGPTLFVSVDKQLVREGLDPAAIGTVRRNTDATGAVTVALSSDDAGEAVVPTEVTIPDGQVSVTFPIQPIDDNVNDGDQMVTLTAAADGFTTGMTTLVVSDRDLPDLIVTDISVTDSADTEEIIPVSYKVANQGLASLSGTPVQRVFLSDDPIVGEDSLVAQFPLEMQLSVGETETKAFGIQMPLSPGDYWVVVTTDAGLAVDEGIESNNTRIEGPIRVSAQYSATVQTDTEVAVADTPITMTGVATRASGAIADSELIDIHVVVRGMRRRFSVRTDTRGAFAYTFEPLPGEAGVYGIAAAHPGVAEPEPQDSFALLGMRSDPVDPRFIVKEADPASFGTLLVENLSDRQLTGVTARVLTAPTNLDVDVSLPGAAGVAVLSPLGSLPLTYSVAARDASITGGEVVVELMTSEGATLDVPIQVSVTPLTPKLSSWPGTLVASMLREQKKVVEFTVTNNGGLETGDLEVRLPNASWMQLATARVIPTLAPGASASISLVLSPNEELPLGEYRGTLVVDNDQVALSVPYRFRAASSEMGALVVEVVDEYTFYAAGEPRVEGATVTLIDEVSGTVVAEATTLADGLVTLSDVPEGYYDLRISAANHTSYSEPVFVEGERTKPVQAFLAAEVVKYVFDVVPTTIEDHSRIEVETVFETNVPVPVIVVEPRVINFDDLQFKDGVAHMEFTLSNHGLVAAQDVSFELPSHPDFEFSALIQDVGVLPANSSLKIPASVFDLSFATPEGVTAIEGELRMSESTAFPPSVVANNIVSGENFQTRAREDGTFLITGLAPGTYEITVPGFELTHVTTLDVREGELTEGVVLQLVAVQTVDGTIIRQSDATPVENAAVTVLDGGNVVAATFTDSSGRYVLVGLPAGQYSLLVEGERLARTVVSSVDLSTTVTTHVENESIVSGGVIDDNGPLDDVGVFLRSTTRDIKPLHATVTSDGSFAVRNLAPGDYTMVVFSEGYSTQETQITVGANQIVNIGAIRLTPANGVGALRGAEAEGNPSLQELREFRESFMEFQLPLLGSYFGPDVFDLWTKYLTSDGPNLTHEEFTDGSDLVERWSWSPFIGKGYRYSSATENRLDGVFDLALKLIEERLEEDELTKCGAERVKPNTYAFDIVELAKESSELADLLNGTDPPKQLNFSSPYDVPGNTAGDVGQGNGKPDAEGQVYHDTRVVDGKIIVEFLPDGIGSTGGAVGGYRISSQLRLTVEDTIDFLPGQLGAALEVLFGTAMLRELERNGLAHDVPFRVTISDKDRFKVIPGYGSEFRSCCSLGDSGVVRWKLRCGAGDIHYATQVTLIGFSGEDCDTPDTYSPSSPPPSSPGRPNPVVYQPDVRPLADNCVLTELPPEGLGEGEGSTRSGGGICAQVRIKIEQTAVQTRDAFDARLQVINDVSLPLADLTAQLMVFDGDDNVVTNLFGFLPPDPQEVAMVDAGGIEDFRWTIIPSVEAAEEQPVEYFVGGSFSYRQGSQLFTVPLSPVSIDVFPTPELYLKYFQQREVFSDDPFTDEIEPAIPFSLGLQVTNRGGGSARNLRVESAQPEIIENEKGLDTSFTIIGSEVEGQPGDASLTLEFGEVAPGETAVGQWFFTTPLHGNYVDLDVTFTHDHSVQTGVDVSLIRATDIYYLVHPVYADGSFDDGLRDFLTNDLDDRKHLADTLHLSDGSVVDVTAVEAADSTSAQQGQTLIVELNADLPDEWGYLRVPDPGQGEYRLVQVLRSDGKELPADNFWQTDRSFLIRGERPVYEDILHLFDYGSTDSYTLTYVPRDASPPTVFAIQEVMDPRTVPVETIDVTFSEPIADSSFDFADLSLSKDGGANLINGNVTIASLTKSVYRIHGLSTLTETDGEYVLTVDAAGVTDPFGNPGIGVTAELWRKGEFAPAIVSILGVESEYRNSAVPFVVVDFSEPIDLESFDDEDISLTRNGATIPLDGQLVISALDGGQYHVAGLTEVTSADGTYSLSVDATGVMDDGGFAGVGVETVTWTKSLASFFVTDLLVDGPLVRRAPVERIDVRLSSSIDPDTFSASDLTLTKDFGADLIDADVTVQQVGESRYLIEGLDRLNHDDGEYLLTMNASGLADIAGNAGSGLREVRWTIDQTAPAAPSDLTVLNSSSHDGFDAVVGGLALTIVGSMPEPDLQLLVLDETNDVVLGTESVTGTSFQQAVTLLSAGAHRIAVHAVDAAGNVSPAGALNVFVDTTRPQIVEVRAPEGTITSPVETIEIELSEPIDLTTFDWEDLTLTLDGSPNRITSDASISHVQGATYRIADLAPLTAAHGSYLLTVDLTEVQDRSGNSGDQRTDATWSFINASKIAHEMLGGPTLNDEDQFGFSVTTIGDLDGDGVPDVAVGAPFDNEATGAVHLLYLNADKSVKQSRRIGFGSTLGPVPALGSFFGTSVASIGDLDGDAIPDLAVGAVGDPTGGSFRGATYIVFLNRDGTARETTRIAHESSGGPTLANVDLFGSSVSPIGDLDGDGIIDLAVGAVGDDTGVTEPGGDLRGAIYVLSMNRDGTAKSTAKIADSTGGGPKLQDLDRFGRSIASIGDIDGDGIEDMAVGAYGDDSERPERGAAYVVFMKSDGTAKHTRKLASGAPGMPPLEDDTRFGLSLAPAGDLDGNGVTDLLAGSPGDAGSRAVYVLLLGEDGTLHSHKRIGNESGGGPALLDGDDFGSSVTAIGDLNGDGTIELAVGAAVDDTGGDNRGAVHIVSLEPLLDYGDAPDTARGTSPANYQSLLDDDGARHQIVSGIRLGATLDADDGTAAGIAADGDDADLAAGDDEDGLVDPRTELLVTIGASPTVRVSATNTTAQLGKLWGWIDYNGDGVFDNATERTQVDIPSGTEATVFRLQFPEVPVGFTGSTYARLRLSTDDAASKPFGLATDGEVEDYLVQVRSPASGRAQRTEIVATSLGPLPSGERLFGSALAAVGDLNSDGVSDLVVGAWGDDEHGTDTGAFYILYLDTDGNARRAVRIDSGSPGAPPVDDFARFGVAITSVGDLNADGVTDLAVGASKDTVTNRRHGAVHILFMNADGTIADRTVVGSELGGGPPLAIADSFGSAVTSIGDLDGDGIAELVVGADRDDSGGNLRGAVYVLFMKADGSVKSFQKIAHDTAGGPALADDSRFGSSVASIGDLDGDGTSDIAVGARRDPNSGVNAGAIYILLMNADGTARETHRIADSEGLDLAAEDFLGHAVAGLGDFDGDGVPDLVVSAHQDDTGGVNRGAIYVLLLTPEGSVKRHVKIANQVGGGPELGDDEFFGNAVVSVGDLNGDGISDLAVSAGKDRFGNENVRILFMAEVDTTPPRPVLTANLSNDPTNQASVPLSVDFGEPVVSFAQDDLALTNGSITDFSSSDGQTYAFQVTPLRDGVVAISVPEAAAEDESANPSLAAQPIAFVSDRTLPAATISSSVSQPTTSDVLPITISFSEPVLGLEASALMLVNAVVTSPLVTVDDHTFSLDLTPVGVGLLGVTVPQEAVRDAAGNSLAADSSFSVQIRSPNMAPTAISLSSTSVQENVPGSVIGSLSASDPNDDDTHSFQVNDNRFEVQGDELKLKSGIALDHEQTMTLSLQITATDSGEPPLSLRSEFVIAVGDANDPPSAVGLIDTAVIENVSGLILGALTVTDQDALDTHSFAVSDPRLEIVGGQLKLKEGIAIDRSSEDTLTIHVTATDSGTPPMRVMQTFEFAVGSNPLPWQNRELHLDANGDGDVSPIDALVVINLLNLRGNGLLNPNGKLPTSRPHNSPEPFYDINGDRFVSPIDALNVINSINDPSSESEGELWGIVVPASSTGERPSNPVARKVAKVSHKTAYFAAVASAAASDANRSSSPSRQAIAFRELDDLLDDLAVDITPLWKSLSWAN